MSFNSWMQQFVTEFRNTTIPEWVAASFGVAEVLLARVNNVLLYPAGIICSAIYIVLMHRAGLHAESVLSAYYVVMSVYGWYHWVKKKNDPPLPISRNGRQDWAITLLIAFAGWGVIYFVLRLYSPSPVNIWDAFVSSVAWAGMWLLARRKVENWLVLNVSNLVAIPLQLHKGLPVTACLTTILFTVAIFGFIEWRKIYRQQPGVSF